MAFLTSGVAGSVLSSTTTDQKFALGLREHGNGDTVWVYVQAATAISAGDLVTITTAFAANRATIADAMTGLQIGVAQIAFAALDYGWVAISGNPLNVNVSATATLNVALYIGTVSGHISTTAGSATLAGVAFLTANTSTAVAAFSSIVSWPRLRIDGLS